MTRKDYELIASAIAEVRTRLLSNSGEWSDEMNVVRDVVESIGQRLALDNPRFDFDRFEKATETLTF